MSDLKIVDFFNGDYMKVVTGIISILAFVISVYNLISAVLKNKVSLNVSVPKISKAVTRNVQLAIIDIVNKSEKNIVISDLFISYDGNDYHAERLPKMFQENTRKRANVIIDRKQHYTSGLPFSISGLNCYSECFEFKFHDKPEIPKLKSVQINLITNKGKKRKNIRIPDYSVPFLV